jgi:hypothetical protein
MAAVIRIVRIADLTRLSNGMGDPPVWICVALEQKASFSEALKRNYAAVSPFRGCCAPCLFEK